MRRTKLLHRRPGSERHRRDPVPDWPGGPEARLPGPGHQEHDAGAGRDPVADAARVSLAVYPVGRAGNAPAAVVLAPTDDWQAAIAAVGPDGAADPGPDPALGAASLPSATGQALAALAPTGSGSAGGAQVIRVGDVPRVTGHRAAAIGGADPYALAAGHRPLRHRRAGKPRALTS